MAGQSSPASVGEEESPSSNPSVAVDEAILPTSGKHRHRSQNPNQMPPDNRSSSAPSSSAVRVNQNDLVPPRLFATDRYPSQGRINQYSKPEYLLDIVEVLDGEPEFGWLKSSYFGRLFELPVRKSSLSGKLVHQMLSRSLVTKKRHEMWFVFGGHPIRFSLREFAIITGLNCGQYPSESELKKMQTTDPDAEAYFHTLIGPKKSYSIRDVLDIMKLDKRLPKEDRMSGERRLRLALIVIVNGILLCNSSNVRASFEVAEMLKDLESFVSYPWGRHSFELTLETVQVGKICPNSAVLVEKLRQSHTATHGFTLSFQLLMLQAVPLLEKFLPDIEDEQTFTDRSVLHLTMLRTYHNSNILETEQDPNLDVESILHTEDPVDVQDYSWVDEVPDEGVDYIFSQLKDGYTFKKQDWHGGFAELPLITVSIMEKVTKAPVTRVRKCHAKKSKKGKQKASTSNDDLHIPHSVEFASDSDILREVDRRNNEHFAKIKQLLVVERSLLHDEIKDHVLFVLREKGLIPPPDSLNHTDLLAQLNPSRWASYGKGLPDILNNLSNLAKNRDIGGQHVSPSASKDSRTDGSKDGTSVEDRCSSSEDILEDVEAREVDIESQICLEEIMQNNMVKTFLGRQSEIREEAEVKDKEIEDNAETSPTVHVGDLMGNDGVEEVGVQEVNDVEIREEAEVKDKEIEENVETSPTVHVGDLTGNDGVKEVGVQEVNDVEKDCIVEEKDRCADILADKFNNEQTTTEEMSTAIIDNTDGNEHIIVADKDFVKQKDTSEEDDTFEEEGTNCLARKRKENPAEPLLTHLPSKRARTKPKRFGQCESSSKKISKELPSEREYYSPYGVVIPAVKKKFKTKLRAYKKKDYIIDGHSVKSSFFEDIYTLKHSVDSPHMEAMLSLLWRTLGDTLLRSRVAVLDTWFTHILCNDYPRFQKASKKSGFPWNSVIKNYVRGIVPTRTAKVAWFTDVDTVYVPMNWGKRHWVACAIKLKEGEILILDPLIVNHDTSKLPRLMKPLVDMLPFIIKEFVNPEGVDYPLPMSFTFQRLLNVYQNERKGDCGPVTVKFIELHAQSMLLDELTDAIVDNIRMKYAVDVYEEFVVPLS